MSASRMSAGASQAPPAQEQLGRAGTGLGRLMRAGWVSDGNLPYADWSALGRRLGAIARCSQWWVGDWVRYGARKYGEQYVEASKLTGYDVQSLRNMAYVASRFSEISRRRDKLSWSHHAELAALPAAAQDRWLARAAEQRLSVADLRVELRAERRRHRAGEEAIVVSRDALEAGEGLRVCPRCGYELVESKCLKLEECHPSVLIAPGPSRPDVGPFLSS